jgi:hypothetical protein
MFRKNKLVYYFHPASGIRKVKLVTKVDGLLSAWKYRNRHDNQTEVGTENYTLYDSKEQLLNMMYSEIDSIKEWIYLLEKDEI